jgi:hypothetical protein
MSFRGSTTQALATTPPPDVDLTLTPSDSNFDKLHR